MTHTHTQKNLRTLLETDPTVTGKMFRILDKLNDVVLGVATQSLLDNFDKENRTPIKSGVNLPHTTVWIDESTPIHKEGFCPSCEFVRIMSDDGKGYCQEHGDINGGPSNDD